MKRLLRYPCTVSAAVVNTIGDLTSTALEFCRRSRPGRIAGSILFHLKESSQPILLVLFCGTLYVAIRREIVINRQFESVIVSMLDEMKTSRQKYLVQHDVTHKKQDQLQATANVIETDVEGIARKLGVDPATRP